MRFLRLQKNGRASFQRLIVRSGAQGAECPAPADVPTPGHGKGEGPDGYKLFGEGARSRSQMTQETLGGAGVTDGVSQPERSSAGAGHSAPGAQL